ncbi:hypothetical protein BY457_10647 [Marinilabilia salmonicolor]|jgi:hypothetical protein|nr:hypothetical protein BY457_10647 [Marinilabilia salmonicolor]
MVLYGQTLSGGVSYAGGCAKTKKHESIFSNINCFLVVETSLNDYVSCYIVVILVKDLIYKDLGCYCG